MNLNDLYPSKYLSASDLGGREVTVTIERLEMQNIGENDTKPIVFFRGASKGLVLNKTNAKNIGSLYGPETNAWIGQQVILFPAYVDFRGETVLAIRVKPPHLAAAAPLPNNPQSQAQFAPAAPVQENPFPPQENPGEGMPNTMPGQQVIDDEVPF